MSKQGKSVLVLGLITTLMGISLIFPGVICGDDGFYVIPVKKGHFSPVAKTGQTQSYRTGDDGDMEKGVAWPNPRFKDNGDGTVTDILTGLIWMENANCFVYKSWNDALAASNTLGDGECGLSDGSSPGDWRLPNVRELQSLVDYGRYNPALPTGHPFTNVQSRYYWSSSTHAGSTSYAWYVDMSDGKVGRNLKDNGSLVWPVRGGN